MVFHEDAGSSLLKSLEIVEMTGEEYLGNRYEPFTPPAVLPKHTKQRTFLKKKKAETTKYPPVPVRPFEERWSEVVDYHRSHTAVSEKELELRYNLLLQWRDSQRNMTINEDTRYIVYWPPQAGIGNTISFLGCALLLSLYTNRKFLRTPWPPRGSHSQYTTGKSSTSSSRCRSRTTRLPRRVAAPSSLTSQIFCISATPFCANSTTTATPT